MRKFSLLYFSLVLIVREKIFFTANTLLGSILFFYIATSNGIINTPEIRKLITIKDFQFLGELSQCLIFGLLSGIRMIHSISETGIMLAVGIGRFGVILLMLTKELFYLFISYTLFLIISLGAVLFTTFPLWQIISYSFYTIILALVGIALIYIPLATHITFKDPYESIRRQK